MNVEQNPAYVVDFSSSPHAKLRPVSLRAIRLADDFWAQRIAANRAVTIPSQHRLLEDTGRLDNFRIAAGKMEGAFQGRYFNDSDIYKWLEAASLALAEGPEPDLEALIDGVIAEVEAAQRPDGYLNTYYSGDRSDERWTNLRDMHELYCAGHLFQAAVAHYRMTGGTRLLDVARRFADHICGTFGPAEEGKRPGAGGHPEIEMGLVELARATGEDRYLRTASFMLDIRGVRNPDGTHGILGGRPYHQDHLPFREFDRMVGHAVRAAYLNSGAADILAETGDKTLAAALERMWQSMTQRQMYVTGGIGSRHEGEAFGDAFELPNARAYTETCAAIAVIMWAWRMLALSGDAAYADVMELALYNGFLSGLGLDGKSYFYVNPLSDDGGHRRQPWYDCACCPPNIARTVAALPAYFYSYGDDGDIWVHLYATGEASLAGPHGSVHLAQRTSYPWHCDVEIEVTGDRPPVLHLRIPGWASGASLEVNGHPAKVAPGGYARVQPEDGSIIRLRLPDAPRWIEAHPYVAEDVGSVALMRGPLVYCVESADQSDVDLRNVRVSPDAAVEAAYWSGLPEGIAGLTFPAHVAPLDAGWASRLYRRADQTRAGSDYVGTSLRAIPYYAWANRQPGQMRVWLRKSS